MGYLIFLPLVKYLVGMGDESRWIVLLLTYLKITFLSAVEDVDILGINHCYLVP